MSSKINSNNIDENCKILLEDLCCNCIKCKKSILTNSTVVIIGSLIIFSFTTLFFLNYHGYKELKRLKDEIEELKISIISSNIKDGYKNGIIETADYFETVRIRAQENKQISNINRDSTSNDSKRRKRDITEDRFDNISRDGALYSGVQQKNNTIKRKSSYTTQSSLHNGFNHLITSDGLLQDSQTGQNDEPASFKHIGRKSTLTTNDYRNIQEEPEIEFTVIHNEHLGRGRHHHGEFSRQPRLGRMRPLQTAHFNGDTSKYILGQHSHFSGNGRIRHPESTYIDWVESSWIQPLDMDKFYSLKHGVLTIYEAGLYFIYAQIYHLDEHDTNGFRVYRNGETLLQCTTTSHSVNRLMKGNTCYTAAAVYLYENDQITLADLFESHYSIFEPGKSFFGAIKLGDLKIK